MAFPKVIPSRILEAAKEPSNARIAVKIHQQYSKVKLQVHR
jgi:hypothetical protein